MGRNIFLTGGVPSRTAGGSNPGVSKIVRVNESRSNVCHVEDGIPSRDSSVFLSHGEGTPRTSSTSFCRLEYSTGDGRLRKARARLRAIHSFRFNFGIADIYETKGPASNLLVKRALFCTSCKTSARAGILPRMIQPWGFPTVHQQTLFRWRPQKPWRLAR